MMIHNNIKMLPTYIEQEHRQIIEKAEMALKEYSEYLLEKINVHAVL